jgi:hypothetical protein
MSRKENIETNFHAIILWGEAQKLKKRQDAALGFPYLDAERWDRAAL